MNELKREINSFLDFNEAVPEFSNFVSENSGSPIVAHFKVVKQAHSYELHKKLFALINFAYKHTELAEIEHDGVMIKQSFGLFRDQLVVDSGFYHVDVVYIFNKDGTIKSVTKRKIADSLSYAKCSEGKKGTIYSAMLDVVANRLASSGYTREKLEELSQEWVKFL